MSIYAREMEWRLDGRTIETAQAALWETDYTTNGAIKKNAKPSHWCVLTDALCSRKVLEQIVLEHNLWINRDNPERQKELLQEEVQKAVKYLLIAVRTNKPPRKEE